MGIFSKLFGGQTSDGSEPESFEQNFSFNDLADTTEIEISEEITKLIQSLGEEAFPDDEGVHYVTEQVQEAGGKWYVEVAPDGETGYSKYVFVTDTKNNIEACYCYDGGGYSLLFT